MNYIKQIPSYLYDLVISRFLTVVAHVIMVDLFLKFQDTDKLMLDVGCGTGKPLHAIIHRFPQDLKVVGVDIDPAYVQTSRQLFKGSNKVVIEQLSFYEVQRLGNQKYDIVFFSFSFMLMPDKRQALELAKSILTENGRVVFLLTLNKNRNPLLQKLKPLIHRITSIDFGQVVYYDNFMKILHQSSLTVCRKERLQSKWNPLFKLFPIYYVEATK